jgi:hypothetical protein
MISRMQGTKRKQHDCMEDLLEYSKSDFQGKKSRDEQQERWNRYFHENVLEPKETNNSCRERL